MVTNLINPPSLVAKLGDDQYLRIGELASRTGLTQRTIRYYEEVGLLPHATRTQGDYRLFSERDVNRLQKIVRLRDVFGFSLAEIRDTIDAEETLEQLRTEYRAADDAATRISKLAQAVLLTEGQLARLEHKVAQIQELKAELEARLNRYVARRHELESILNPQPIESGDESIRARG